MVRPASLVNIHELAFHGSPNVTFVDPEGGTVTGHPSASYKTVKVKKNLTKTLYKGQKYQIVTPGKTIKSCSSSNKKIAKVTKAGLITVKKTGTVKITVKLKGGKKRVLTAKVKDPTIPTKVSFSPSTAWTVYKGEKLNLKQDLKLKGPLAAVQAKSGLKWKSSNTKVAKVNKNGVVTPKKVGTVKITVTAKRGGKKATVKVKVKDPKLPTSIAFNIVGYLAVGDQWDAKHSLKVTWPRPALAPAWPKWSSWKSSNNALATVSKSGIVTALKPGWVTITCVTSNGKKASGSIEIRKDDGSVG